MSRSLTVGDRRDRLTVFYAECGFVRREGSWESLDARLRDLQAGQEAERAESAAQLAERDPRISLPFR